MAFDAIIWAYERDNSIGTAAKFVLVTLAKHSGMDRRCWPSQRLLMQECALSERTVRIALNTLEENGFITREKRSGRGGRISDLFRICLDDVEVDEGPNRQILPVPNRQMLPDLPAESARAHSLSLETPVKELRARDVARFDEFWKLYPRRAQRGAAEKAWRKVVGHGVRVDDLIAGAARYAQEMAGVEERFIRHASTWLNNDGWKDEPAGSDKGGNLFHGNVTSQRLDPPDDLVAEWSAAGVRDEDLPARIRSWRQEQLAGVTG